MGNSPSKNEALPTSDNQTANSQSSTPSGDLEPDESGPALSQLSSSLTTPRSAPSTSSTTPNEFNDQQGNTRSSAINIRTLNSNHYKSTPSTNNNTKPAPTVNTNTNSSTYTIPNDDRKERKRSGSASPMKARKLELELEIGASMAKLLKTQEYSSSLDSDSGSTVSPVFTTMGECEKRPGTEDEDLLLSLNLGSPSGKTFLYDSKESLPVLSKLDSIAEGTFECSDKEKDASQSSKKLSSSNLKKLQRKSSIGTALTKHLLSTSSSSQLSNSPPLVHSSKKLEVDIDAIIDRLLDVGMKKPSANYTSRRHLKDPLPVSPSEIKYILHKARLIFLEQPTLLRLSPPVKIVGDIHGQFHDLIRIFNSCGYPPYSNYLFLGDYVDRGYKSLETILLLLCYKVKYPENFFMLRGNHELANITKIYGFYDECKRRLPSNKIWKDFIDVFNSLPIAATINDKIFCIHGGLSPDLQDLKQIENIKRPTDIPDKGLLADLLWSDPDPLVKNFSLTNWPKNDRGVLYRFGRKHVDYFCATFKMDLVVRGHMVVEDGYEFFNRRKLVTVFSAPNYCGEFNNFGAVMSVDKSLYCSFELIKPQ